MLRALRSLIYGNIFVACCAASLVAMSQLLLFGQARHDGALGLVFFSTLLVYNLDRVLGTSPEDRHDRSARHLWTNTHDRALWALASCGALGAALCALTLPPKVILAMLLLGAISLSYSVPVLRYKGKWRRLKEIPGLKLLLIGWVWALATVSLPAALGAQADPPNLSGPQSEQALALLGQRLLFIVAITLPFDVRDLARDRAANILTLPHLLGLQYTRALGVVLALGSGLWAWWMPWPLPLRLSLVITNLIGAALILKAHERQPELYYSLLLDGTMLLPLALSIGLERVMPGA